MYIFFFKKFIKNSTAPKIKIPSWSWSISSFLRNSQWILSFFFVLYEYILFKCLHKNNIIHRDFKAANVMINDSIFKIGDFGFAKEAA